jgi:hypothetical protein
MLYLPYPVEIHTVRLELEMQTRLSTELRIFVDGKLIHQADGYVFSGVDMKRFWAGAIVALLLITGLIEVFTHKNTLP